MAVCHICTLAKGKAFLSMGTVRLYRSHIHHVSPDLMACFFLDPKLTSCRSQLHTYPLIHSTNAFCCPRSMVHWDNQMKRGCSGVTYLLLPSPGTPSGPPTPLPWTSCSIAINETHLGILLYYYCKPLLESKFLNWIINSLRPMSMQYYFCILYG